MRSVIIVLVALQATAYAEPSVRAKAAAHFKQGQEFFKASDFEHAIEEYEAAYALSNEPLLIFNIALCHDRAQRPEQALAAFKRYLELAPNGEVADEAREDVVRLTRVIETERAKHDAEVAHQADAERQAKAAREAAAAEAARRDAEATRRALRATRLTAESDRLASRARIETIAAIAVGTVGLVGVGIGVKYGLDAKSAADALTANRAPWTDALLARDAEGKSAETKMLGFTIAGGVAVVGAGVLYVLARHHGGEADALRLELAPDHVAIGAAF